MKCVACIGNFDGVHMGHQALINKTIEIANKKVCIPTAITFDINEKDCLYNLKKKKDVLTSFGIEDIIIFPFDHAFKMISKDIFIEKILNNLEIDTLVCGKDFTFGCGKEGNVEYLLNNKNRNFDVVVVDDVIYNGRKVSSSWLKEIKDSDKELFNILLNHKDMLK